MAGYEFVKAFVDPNNIFLRNNYVYVKENTQQVQHLKHSEKENKTEEERPIVVKGITPAQKETEIAKVELGIETNQIKQPDSLDTSQFKLKKRRTQVYYDSLS